MSVLTGGKSDALAAYSTDEPFALREAGVDYLSFSPRAGDIDFYGDTLFTSQKEMQNHPERVKRFLDASLEGWRYALDHQEEIVELILSKYSQRHSRDQLLFEAQETYRLMQPDLVEVGYNNPGHWRAIADVYADQHMMPAGMPLDGLIYERNPRPSLRWLFSALGVSILISVAVIILAGYLYWLNRTIHKQKESLQYALDQIKVLRGIIPVCSYCKKIRNDEGAWQEMVRYITENSEATFSHGICTDCFKKMYGDDPRFASLGPPE